MKAPLFGKRAEALVQYLRKGKSVSVTLNNLREDKYTKQDGTVTTKLIGDVIDIELCPDGTQQAQAAPPLRPALPAPGAGANRLLTTWTTTSRSKPEDRAVKEQASPNKV